MGTHICWEKANLNYNCFHVPAPISFMEMMERAGFKLPITLGQSDIPKLSGMGAVFGGPKPEIPNPFYEIIKAIEDSNGDIFIWAER